MAKRKQQDEMAPNGPGIAGIFNEAPTYYLPGTPGDVGALAIDYPTMRAEPWSQTAAPIFTSPSPQGEVLAAPLGAPASDMALGNEWKDLYSLMGNEIDVYRKYLKDFHDLGGQYFPKITATSVIPSDLEGAGGWYDPKTTNITIPLYSGGYSGGDYMDVGPTVRQTPTGGYEQAVPVITNPNNPKMSIRMDMSPIPHEIGHYYDFTGAPVEDNDHMSWAYYNRGEQNPWDYILTNMSGTLRPEQATGDEQSWFMSGGAPKRGRSSYYDVPVEMFADYFRKALTAGVLNDIDRINKLYDGKSPVTIQSDQPSPAPLKGGDKRGDRYESGVATAREAAANEADRLNTQAKNSPNAPPAKTWPKVFDAVANLAESVPPVDTQARMRPMLTDQAREFLYWLFTRGYNPP
jgi:hypothetical protein